MSIYCLWLSFYQNGQGKWLEQETRCSTEPEVCPLWPFMKLFTDLSIALGGGGVPGANELWEWCKVQS